MKHLFIILAAMTLVTGCGKTDVAKVDAVANASGQPAMEDAKTCIKDFLVQCGMQHVEVSQLTETPVPSAAKTASSSWGYQFTAEYTNILGESAKSQNWVAVVAIEDGKVMVRTCWDDNKQMVGGHQGHVNTPGADLIPVDKSAAKSFANEDIKVVGGQQPLGDLRNAELLPLGKPK